MALLGGKETSKVFKYNDAHSLARAYPQARTAGGPGQHGLKPCWWTWVHVHIVPPQTKMVVS